MIYYRRFIQKQTWLHLHYPISLAMPPNRQSPIFFNDIVHNRPHNRPAAHSRDTHIPALVVGFETKGIEAAGVEEHAREAVDRVSDHFALVAAEVQTEAKRT